MKHSVTVTCEVAFTFDTDDYPDDFAKTKDDLADKLDPTDSDVVHDYIADNVDEFVGGGQIIDEGNISYDDIKVKPMTAKV